MIREVCYDGGFQRQCPRARLFTSVWIAKDRPFLTIEINERVLKGIERRPDNLALVQRAICEQLNRFFAEHVSWIGGVYDGK